MAQSTTREGAAGIGRSLRVSILVLAVSLAGCFRGEPPLAPEEALREASARITDLLGEDRIAESASGVPEPTARAENPSEAVLWYYQDAIIAPAAASRRAWENAFAERFRGMALRAQFIGAWDVAIQKLVVSLAAGDLPDIACVKRAWLARLAGSGRITELDELLPEALLNDFSPGLLDDYRKDGRLYALPANGFCSVLYVNSDLLAAAPPRTWAELRRIAGEWRSKAGPEAARAFAIGHFPFVEALWSAGGEVCDALGSTLDTVPAREALEFILALRDDGLAHPRAIEDPGLGVALFLRGDVAMTVASSAEWPRMREAGFPVAMSAVPGKTVPVTRRSDDAIVVFRRHAASKGGAIVAALDFLTGDVQRGHAAAGAAPLRQGAPADSVPAGLQDAFACGRNTPLVGSWGAVEFEMMRYLRRAFEWCQKDAPGAP